MARAGKRVIPHPRYSPRLMLPPTFRILPVIANLVVGRVVSQKALHHPPLLFLLLRPHTSRPPIGVLEPATAMGPETRVGVETPVLSQYPRRAGEPVSRCGTQEFPPTHMRLHQHRLFQRASGPTTGTTATRQSLALRMEATVDGMMLRTPSCTARWRKMLRTLQTPEMIPPVLVPAMLYMRGGWPFLTARCMVQTTWKMTDIQRSEVFSPACFAVGHETHHWLLGSSAGRGLQGTFLRYVGRKYFNDTCMTPSHCYRTYCKFCCRTGFAFGTRTDFYTSQGEQIENYFSSIPSSSSSVTSDLDPIPLHHSHSTHVDGRFVRSFFFNTNVLFAQSYILFVHTRAVRTALGVCNRRLTCPFLFFLYLNMTVYNMDLLSLLIVGNSLGLEFGAQDTPQLTRSLSTPSGFSISGEQVLSRFLMF